MICKYSYEDIIKYSENNLSAEYAQELKMHFENCKKCKCYYEALEITQELVLDESLPKKGIHDSIMSKVDKYRYQNKKYSVLHAINSFIPRIKYASIVILGCLIFASLILNASNIKRHINQDKVSVINTPTPTIPTTTKEDISEEDQKQMAIYKDLTVENYLATVNNGNTIIYYIDHLTEEMKTTLVGKEKENVKATIVVKNQEGIKSFNIRRGHTPDSILVSTDGEFIYLWEDGTVKVLDVKNNTQYDLLEKLGFDKKNQSDDYCSFYYLNYYMVISIDKESILVDLKNNSFQYINLKYQSWYFSDSKEFMTVEYDENKKPSFHYSNYYISITDLKGNIKKEIKDMDLPNNGGFSYFAPSDDGKYILYSLGKTPSSLYLYDVNNNKSYIIADDDYHDLRLTSNWDKDGVFYYKLMDENKNITVNKANVKDIIEDNTYHTIKNNTIEDPIPLEFKTINVTESVEVIDRKVIKKIYIEKEISYGKVFIFSNLNDEEWLYGGIEIGNKYYSLGVVSMLLRQQDMDSISIQEINFCKQKLLRIFGAMGANYGKTSYFSFNEGKPDVFLTVSGFGIEKDIDGDGNEEIIASCGTAIYTCLYKYEDGQIKQSDINLDLNAISVPFYEKTNNFLVFYGGEIKTKLFKFNGKEMVFIKYVAEEEYHKSH